MARLQGKLLVHTFQPAFDLLEEAGGGETVEGAMVEAEREVHHRADADHVVYGNRLQPSVDVELRRRARQVWIECRNAENTRLLSVEE
jgi:hypothetical protein